MQRGDGVVVVEHSLDLIARADWIVDLGPGGGAHGGELLFCGPLAAFLDEGESPTAEELRRHLRWTRHLGNGGNGGDGGGNGGGSGSSGGNGSSRIPAASPRNGKSS